jgi:polysaccharide biosynthesis/export protein ExoF
MKARSAMAAAALLAWLGIEGAAIAQHRLAPSETVRVRVRDWPDISGEYMVNPDGRLSMPVIGDIEAAGLGTAELAHSISAAIRRSSGSGDQPVTAVEMVRFRPFFVQGDVQRPGEHAFRPGLTVLQAVSVAGGYYRPTSANILRTDRDVANATGDIDAQAWRRLKAAARSARLESALAERETIEFPQDLLSRREEAAVVRLLDNERALLSQERRRADDEARSLQDIRALYQREIASLQQQTEALKREQEALQRQLSELRSLAGRGLALTPNVISLERTLAQNQNEQLGMATAAVRARQAIELAEQRARDQRAERRRQQGEELQQTASEAADANLRIATAEALIAEALQTERIEGRNPGLELMQRRTVMLVRSEGGTTRETAVGDDVILQPGDVLKVLPLPPRRPPAQAGASR